MAPVPTLPASEPTLPPKQQHSPCASVAPASAPPQSSQRVTSSADALQRLAATKADELQKFAASGIASARLSVTPSAASPTDIDPRVLQSLPFRFGGHGLTPLVGDGAAP